MPLTYHDAYCHIGLPRFGIAEDAISVLDQNGVQKAIFVLGPMVPDYATLFSALNKYGNRIRGVGIPFGQNQSQVNEIVALQLEAGALGLRLQNDEIRQYDEALRLLGEAERWLYAVSFIQHDDLVKKLLAWLEKYPQAKIAAPHFLSPQSKLHNSLSDGPRRELLSHPRFYPIFSRHGGVGSQQPYPHPDLAEWVNQVVDLTGWERILWGSEYPVIYWRNESLATCQQWLSDLRPDLTSTQKTAFYGANVQKAIFDAPAPAPTTVNIPTWVESAFNRQRVVPLFEKTGLDIPMSLYQELHHQYVQALQHQPDLAFKDFITQRLTA